MGSFLNAFTFRGSVLDGTHIPTFGDFKKLPIYKNAVCVTLCINNEDDADPNMFETQFDNISVERVVADENFKDVVVYMSCCNWDSHEEPGWVARQEEM
jgi:hypothetical protein